MQRATRKRKRDNDIVYSLHRDCNPISQLSNELRGTVVAHCRVCSDIAGEYLVHDDVWAQALLHPYAGRVCINCLDIRLIKLRQQGLQSYEFPHAPVNQSIHFALALLTRRNTGG